MIWKISARGRTWIDAIDGYDSERMSGQYIRAYHFVLGHLIAAPIDCGVAPTSNLERGFTVGLIMMSLLVLGAGISKMANTIDELNRMSSESAETKRVLRRYLVNWNAPATLSMRITRFVLHAQLRRKTFFLEPYLRGLLSSSLESELLVIQRRKFMAMNPLFDMVAEEHP